MRLLGHNILVCNTKTCNGQNHAMKLFIEKSEIIEKDFRPTLVTNLAKKLNWELFIQTVASIGQQGMPT